jgi:hypothetical protein
MEASYTMVAEARGQCVLWYRQFGAYDGEWLLMSRDDNLFYLYRGSYGSCSGCDALQSEFSYDRDLTPDMPRVQNFIADYPPFLEMKIEAAQRVVEREGNLLAVLPRNRREWYDREFDHETVGRQLALIVKAEAGTISASEILELDNQELRRTTLENFGVERFFEEVLGEIDRDGEDLLIRIEHSPEPFVFLYLKDSSSDRRYLLRVAPDHKTVLAARAASFGFTPEQFVLAEET